MTDAPALAAAVLRAVPDATPERVEALLRVGLAVERLEGSGQPWSIGRHRKPCGYSVTMAGGKAAAYRGSLEDAVTRAGMDLAAALGDAP